MLQYERTMTNHGKESRIVGSKCDRCGYIKLDDDGDVWSIVGLRLQHNQHIALAELIVGMLEIPEPLLRAQFESLSGLLALPVAVRDD